MSVQTAALVVLILIAHSSAQLDDGCYSQVQISQRFCTGGEDFVDRTSRLSFDATCDFNTSAGYLQVNFTDKEILNPIIQYACQTSNGTILADNPPLYVEAGENHFTIDSDAEVCFFYGCFKDTQNFDRACYVNSTSMATCRRKDLSHEGDSSIVPSSSMSTSSTNVLPTVNATSLVTSNTSISSVSLMATHSIGLAEKMSTVSGNSQSLSSSAEVFDTKAPQQTNNSLSGSSSLSAGFIIGIIVFGFVLIIIVASISILALYYSCGANTHKKKIKSYPSSELFSGIEATHIDYLPNFEINMEECDIVTICGSLEHPPQYTIEIKSKENEYVTAPGSVEPLLKDRIYCANQKYSKDKIVEVTSEMLVSEIRGSTKLSAKTCDGYIDSQGNTAHDTVSISTQLTPEDFEDEPEILSDEELSVCISPAPTTRQEGCRSQNSCYTDTSSVRLDDSHSLKACDAVTHRNVAQDSTIDGYIQSEQFTGASDSYQTNTVPQTDSSEWTDGYIDNQVQYAQTVGCVTPSDTNSSTGSYLTTDLTAEICPSSGYIESKTFESQPLTSNQPACEFTDGYIDSPIQYAQTVGDVTSSDGAFTTDHEHWDVSVCQPHHLNDQLPATSPDSGYIGTKTFTDSHPFTGDADESCEYTDDYVDSPIQYTRTVGTVTPSDTNSSTGYFTTDQHWDSSACPPHHFSSQPSSTAKPCSSDISSDYIDSRTYSPSFAYDQSATSEYTVDGYIDNPAQYTRTVGNVTPSDASSSTGYFTTERYSPSENYPQHILPSKTKYCSTDINSDYIDSKTFTDSQPLSPTPCQQYSRDTHTQHAFNNEFIEWGSLESLSSV